MFALKCCAIIFLCFGALFILGYSLGSGKPLRHLFCNALIGIAAFAAVMLTERFTGVHLALNGWTAGGTAVFGIPAVCGFLLLRLIFGA